MKNRVQPQSSGAGDDFFSRVHDVVALIPRGRVTTYGHIAAYLGARRAARTVGWALQAAKGTLLPCHRVVNRQGYLTGRLKFGGPHIMEDLLRNEGVGFDGDGRVRLERHLWDPGEALTAKSATGTKGKGRRRPTRHRPEGSMQGDACD